MSGTPTLPAGLHAVAPGQIACVVTSLAMARPGLVPPPVAREGLGLRRVHDPDPAWYRDVFRRVGAPWLWCSRLQMDDAALSAVIGHRDVLVQAVTCEGIDAGLLELDLRGQGTCEIAFLGLAPTLVGQGIGRWLMAHALALAWAHPITRLWVHTCTLDHPAALAFYQRSGFTAIASAVEVMDDPRQTGLLDPAAAPHVPLL